MGILVRSRVAEEIQIVVEQDQDAVQHVAVADHRIHLRVVFYLHIFVNLRSSSIMSMKISSTRAYLSL